MLLDDTAILDRHFPSTKRNQTCTKPLVDRVKRSSFVIRHKDVLCLVASAGFGTRSETYGADGAVVQTNPFRGIPETFYGTDHPVSANFGCFAAFFMIAQPPR